MRQSLEPGDPGTEHEMPVSEDIDSAAIPDVRSLPLREIRELGLGVPSARRLADDSDNYSKTRAFQSFID